MLFDDAGMKPDTYLNQFYPHEINAEKYRSIVVTEFERLYERTKLHIFCTISDFVSTKSEYIACSSVIFLLYSV